MSEKIVNLAAGPTAVGSFVGSIASLLAPDMGAAVIKSLRPRRPSASAVARVSP